MGKTKSWKATSLREKAQQKHDRGFDFREQGGRREGSCERFTVMANKEDEEDLIFVNKEDKQKVRARDLG